MSTRLDPRIASLTPDRLTDIVTSGGGRIADTWDYTYTPEEGGDGTTGHYVLYLEDADGEVLGNVGFARALEGIGVAYTISDFEDYRYSKAGEAGTPVANDQDGFLNLLSAFLPGGF